MKGCARCCARGPQLSTAETWKTSRGSGLCGEESADFKGFTETDYAGLLDAAHQQLADPNIVVWDNLNAHVSAAMTDLIAARDWRTACRLPPYAHELNPVEQVWSHLKRSLANLTKRNLSQLTPLIKTRLRRMQ